jgi:hypothetical protein
MKKVSVMTILALAVLALGVPVFAQETADSAAPQMPPMGPPAELQQMAKMAGSWDYAGEMRMSPDAPWTPHTAYNVNSFVCGGAAFQTDFTGPMMGMEMKGLGLTMYDRETGKWQTIWIDNIAARISYYEGDFKDGKLVFSGQDKMQGQTMYTRITYFDITDTTHKFLMENSMDGQTWFVSMQGTYTKKQ